MNGTINYEDLKANLIEMGMDDIAAEQEVYSVLYGDHNNRAAYDYQ